MWNDKHDWESWVTSFSSLDSVFIARKWAIE